MRKEQKQEVVLALTEQIQEYGNFYITDTANLSVAKVNDIRRKCFDNDIKMQVAKNKLIRKAMEASEGDYSEMFDVLKGSSSILFSKSANAPAKLIKQLRKSGDKPILKAAYIDSSVFIGDINWMPLSTLNLRKNWWQILSHCFNLLLKMLFPA